MDAEDVTDLEDMKNTIWSTSRLYLRLLETFPNYVQDFQAKWNDWQQGISAHDPSTWSSVPSFTALTALGPQIIPLVVYQLALNQNDNTAVHLYTTLETDPLYLPGSSEVGPPALQILRLSFDRNRAVRNALADWAEYSEQVSRHSTSTMYTECAEYDTLLGFGKSIIPQVMLQYAHDIKAQSGAGVVSASGIGRGVLFWYELLHELVWGCKTGVQTVEFGEMYKRWEAWFQGGGGVEGVPRFGREAA
ncbi:hypothetical protein QBC40DRAFT_291111 [Triangularia verruculosa]|uniref:Uncharacterized protein n=1 Tax=Triangularia verruculosa TaxID=2587418 RepID=A0AAN6X737_9PEZI|nr:hypothetical protein QBC40DRAFT_291111 [Triangularia verruculosa]